MYTAVLLVPCRAFFCNHISMYATSITYLSIHVNELLSLLYYALPVKTCANVLMFCQSPFQYCISAS